MEVGRTPTLTLINEPTPRITGFVSFSLGFKNCRFRIGWRCFPNANKLLKGDVLVFCLIEHCKFKVYIARSCKPKKVDGAIRNPKKYVLIGTGMPFISYFRLNYWKIVKESYHGLLVQNTVKENGDRIAEARNSMAVKEYYSDQADMTEKTKFDHTPAPHRNNLCSDASGGIRFSASVVKFQDMKRFEDFKIYLDGLILDSELPVHAKMKYYELCCSQKMFLHDSLMTGLGSKLVTGMISETSNIADAIKSTTLAASLRNLESWDKTLKAFEDLGMSVGFLRSRIDNLVKISREYQTINESKGAKFAQVEEKKRALTVAVSTMDALRKSIVALKELIKRLEAEIDGVEGKNEGLGFEFNKIATAPW